MDPISFQKGLGKATYQKVLTLSFSLPLKGNGSNKLVKPKSYFINSTTSSHQHILPLIFQSAAGQGSARGREHEGVDRVRRISEMPAHSICRVFCVNFLLSSEAPNSAELKWNEVIRAAGCKDVLGLASQEMWGRRKGRREESLKERARQETHPQGLLLGKASPPPPQSLGQQLSPQLCFLRIYPGPAPHNQTPPSISSPLFRNSHQIYLSSTHTKLIILLLYHSSLCLCTCNYYTVLK